MKFLRHNQFFTNFGPQYQHKVIKHMLIIAIDYLENFFKKSQISYQEIRNLSNSILSKKAKSKVSNEISEIKEELLKLRTKFHDPSQLEKKINSLHFSEKKLQISDLVDEKKKIENIKQKTNEQKNDELNKNYLNNETDEIMKNFNNKNRPKRLEFSDSKPVSGPRSSFFSVTNRRNLDFDSAGKKIQSPLANPQKLFAISKSPKISANQIQRKKTNNLKPSKKEKKQSFIKFKGSQSNKIVSKSPKNQEKIRRIPNYLLHVESKIKAEVDFHKKLFKSSKTLQTGPIFEQDVHDVMTFGSSKNPSPIDSCENSIKYEKINHNNIKEDNSNIAEIANSFLKSPLMIQLAENQKNEENYSGFSDSKGNGCSRITKKISFHLNNIEKKDNYRSNSNSNLLQDITNREVDTSSSTFSMLMPNEELKGFFQKEFLMQTLENSNKYRRNSEVGKIKKNKENNVFLNGKLC